MLSIIIPNRDKVKELDNTILSILEDNEFLGDFEIIVANDGNSNEITNYINDKSNYIDIKQIVIKKSFGSYFARNRALEISSGDLILFVDSGIKLQCGWFKKITKDINKYDYIAGQIKLNFEKTSPVGEKIDALMSFPISTYMDKLHFAPTAFLLVKKELLNRVGFFNENIFSGGDFEFGIRAYDLGAKQILSYAVAIHAPRNFKAQYKKRLRVIKGHYDLSIMNPDKFSNPVSLFKVIKNIVYEFLLLLDNLILFFRNEVYLKGQISFLKYIYGMTVFRLINIVSLLRIMLLKNKIYNG